MYLQDLLDVCESRQTVQVSSDGAVVEGTASALLSMLDKKVLVCEVAFVNTSVKDYDSPNPIMRVVTKE